MLDPEVIEDVVVVEEVQEYDDQIIWYDTSGEQHVEMDE